MNADGRPETTKVREGLRLAFDAVDILVASRRFLKTRLGIDDPSNITRAQLDDANVLVHEFIAIGGRLQRALALLEGGLATDVAVPSNAKRTLEPLVSFGLAEVISSMAASWPEMSPGFLLEVRRFFSEHRYPIAVLRKAIDLVRVLTRDETNHPSIAHFFQAAEYVLKAHYERAVFLGPPYSADGADATTGTS